LFAALMAGYVIGKFVPRGKAAFGVCTPVSIVCYALVKSILGELPSIEMIIMVGVLQSPILMLGVVLARRNSKRNSYETE
jgi:hypothetical protein